MHLSERECEEGDFGADEKRHWGIAAGSGGVSEAIQVGVEGRE